MNELFSNYPFDKGILTINTSSFSEFKQLIESNYFRTKNQDFIYRGQADATWKTTSSITRIISKDGSVKYPNILEYQLNNFKNSVMGRRGVNPEKYKSDIEWWALGQHYELGTPMLDFTFSPYVATFFAFEEDRTQPGKPTNDRAILALNYKMLCQYYDFDKITECSRIKAYKPKMDDNPRIVAQSGLLVYIPVLTDLESIIQSCFENSTEPVLIKFTVPDSERLSALKILQKMNITDSTIYPDVIGASKFCNMKLAIKDY